MPYDIGRGRIIHACAPQCPFGKCESTGFDDVDRYAETGCQTQDRARVSGDIGVVKGNSHSPADMRMYRNAAIMVKWDWQRPQSSAISAANRRGITGGAWFGGRR
jgi:hypothetical protein